MQKKALHGHAGFGIGRWSSLVRGLATQGPREQKDDGKYIEYSKKQYKSSWMFYTGKQHRHNEYIALNNTQYLKPNTSQNCLPTLQPARIHAFTYFVAEFTRVALSAFTISQGPPTLPRGYLWGSTALTNKAISLCLATQ